MKINDHHAFTDLSGKYVLLREVRVEDATFILSLRRSEKGMRFLHYTEGSEEKQRQYIERYLTLNDEWYFIVENKAGERIGCLSAYDVRGGSVCTGRWVMKDGVPFQQSIEADLLLKDFVFHELQASEIRMDTRHENKNMQAYFKMWGCVEVTRSDELIYVVLPYQTYCDNRAKVARFCQ